MVEKSRTKRRVFVRTPGAKTKKINKLKKVSTPKCAECGAVLKGVLTKSSAALKRTAKSKKTPQRKYGGNLCTKCSRKKIVNSVRK